MAVIDTARLIHAIKLFRGGLEPATPVWLAEYVSNGGDGWHTVYLLNPDGSTGPETEVRGRCSAWEGTILRVGFDARRFGSDMCILGVDEAGYGTAAAPSILENHGERHGMGRVDQIPNLATWQIYPLRVQPYSGLTVAILAGPFFANGVYAALETAYYISMSSYLPGTSSKELFATVSINSAKTITVTQGAEVNYGAITAGDIPLPPVGDRPLAAILLRYGDTSLPQSRFYADLRFMPGGVNANTGIDPSLDVYIDGPLAAVADVAAVVVSEACDISAVYIRCKVTGTAGTTTVDAHKNGTTIFTTQANRPQLAWDDGDGVAVSGTPDVVSLAAGDRLTFDIDAIATGARCLAISVAKAGVTA